MRDQRDYDVVRKEAAHRVFGAVREPFERSWGRWGAEDSLAATEALRDVLVWGLAHLARLRLIEAEELERFFKETWHRFQGAISPEAEHASGSGNRDSVLQSLRGRTLPPVDDEDLIAAMLFRHTRYAAIARQLARADSARRLLQRFPDEEPSRPFPEELRESRCHDVFSVLDEDEGASTQEIRDEEETSCGSILWMTREGSWRSEWVWEIRERAGRLRADLSVLVVDALPDRSQLVSVIDGVWIAQRSTRDFVAVLLSNAVEEIGKAARGGASESQREETREWLKSEEFRDSVVAAIDMLMIHGFDVARHVATTYGSCRGIPASAFESTEEIQSHADGDARRAC